MEKEEKSQNGASEAEAGDNLCGGALYYMDEEFGKPWYKCIRCGMYSWGNSDDKCKEKFKKK